MVVSSLFRHFVLTAVGALSLAGIFSAQAGNLIENPGFESGVDDKWWLLVPEQSIELAEPLKVSEEKENVHEGRKSVEIITRGMVRVGVCTKKVYPVRPGDRYRFTAWVKFGKDAKIEGKVPAAYLRFTLFGEDKKDIPAEELHMHIGLNGKMARQKAVGSLWVAGLPRGWQKIEGVVEIPEGVAYVGPVLMIDGVVGTCYYDDADFEKVSSTTPLSREIK
jgi:hypothetical protein